MPPRRPKESGLPAVNSPVLFDYSEQLAILLFGKLMKWLRPMVRRGDSIPLADLKDALWAVKEAWELHRDIAHASGPQHLTAVPAEELDALTAGYDFTNVAPWLEDFRLFLTYAAVYVLVVNLVRTRLGLDRLLAAFARQLDSPLKSLLSLLGELVKFHS